VDKQNDWLSLSEVSVITSRSVASIRTTIKRRGNVKAKKKMVNNHYIWFIHRDELGIFYDQAGDHVIKSGDQAGDHVIRSGDQVIKSGDQAGDHVIRSGDQAGDHVIKSGDQAQKESISRDDIREVVKGALDDLQVQLMKPLEQQALYRLGVITERYTQLQDKYETVVQENNFLREQMNLLPVPVEVVKSKMAEQESAIKQAFESMEEMKTKVRDTEGLFELVKREREQAENKQESLSMKVSELEQVEREKEQKIKELEKIQEIVSEEKEREIKALKEEKDKELDDVQRERETLKEVVNREKAIREELERKLKEEQTRPWWKKMLGLK